MLKNLNFIYFSRVSKYCSSFDFCPRYLKRKNHSQLVHHKKTGGRLNFSPHAVVYRPWSKH